MKKLPIYVCVSPTNHPRTWTVEFPVKWRSRLGYVVPVPPGMVTDGASIPKGFRWMFPHGGSKFPAAVLHDRLYKNNECVDGSVVTRKEADLMFLEAMKYCGVPGWKATTMYYGLRIGGWFTWATYRKKLPHALPPIATHTST